MEAGKVQPLPGISQWASVGDLASIKYLVQKEGPPIFQVTDSHGRTGRLFLIYIFNDDL